MIPFTWPAPSRCSSWATSPTWPGARPRGQDVNRPPVVGITGTGGAGKSSLTDELNRIVRCFPDRRVAVVAMDPTQRRSGGALLGDRIRMNALAHEQIFMRSLATRRQHLATSAALADTVQLLKAAGFDLIVVETAGIGQSGTEIVDLVDLSMYVMTADYGAASQLEKIDMLDFADFIVLNKFEKRGAEDALRDVRKQVAGAQPQALQDAAGVAAGLSDDREPVQRRRRQCAVQRAVREAARAVGAPPALAAGRSRADRHAEAPGHHPGAAGALPGGNCGRGPRYPRRRDAGGRSRGARARPLPRARRARRRTAAGAARALRRGRLRHVGCVDQSPAPESSVSDWPARQADGSSIAGFVDEELPEPPDTLRGLAGLIGRQRWDDLLTDLGRGLEMPPPPLAAPVEAGVAAQVAPSVLRIEGVACGITVQGTGFVVSPDLVLTNAHVIAGVDHPLVASQAVEPGAAPEPHQAEVVHFDPAADLAVLRVEGLGLDPLPLSSEEATDGGVFGYPRGATSIEVSPYTVAHKDVVEVPNLDGSSNAQRSVYFLAANLQEGDSGAPLVDPSGEVAGVAFAVAPDRAGLAFAATVSELRKTLEVTERSLAEDPAHTEGTGACLERDDPGTAQGVVRPGGGR